MNQCKPMQVLSGRLWGKVLACGLLLLLTAAFARGEEPSEPVGQVPVRSLADAGDTSTPEAAQATLDTLAQQLVEKGGGYIVVDNRVVKGFKPHNRYQTGRDQPSVTILDVRDPSRLHPIWTMFIPRHRVRQHRPVRRPPRRARSCRYIPP